MTSASLENLARTGALKKEAPVQSELEGLIGSARVRLKDAKNEDLSLESRFDLAYNAAHSICLAALRRQGYRPDKKRYVVFQTIPETVGLGPEVWRVLDKAHGMRNDSEYEGRMEVDENFLGELLKATDKVVGAVLEMFKSRVVKDAK